MSLGRAVAVVGAAFCLTLAIIVVRELSSEALSVAIGVVCGVAAGIPATILLYVTLSGPHVKGVVLVALALFPLVGSRAVCFGRIFSGLWRNYG
ncbi:MAG: hypothetical protein BWY06_03511 [Candidatus Latescibacteria bacterium ADurb.Bin168]|nr:MAG: hypothetical protein BWY06_03511 [Candidatus Latescibacteria bacterium ADurb.Bin168]